MGPIGGLIRVIYHLIKDLFVDWKVVKAEPFPQGPEVKAGNPFRVTISLIVENGRYFRKPSKNPTWNIVLRDIDKATTAILQPANSNGYSQMETNAGSRFVVSRDFEVEFDSTKVETLGFEVMLNGRKAVDLIVSVKVNP